MNTLTIESRALMVASRQWKELSPELQRDINIWTMFAHQTAPLIKALKFSRLLHDLFVEDNCYIPAHLRVEGFDEEDDNYPMFLISPRRSLRELVFVLNDFGDAEYDRFQIDSDNASGITLGRVVGTGRWGHVAWI